MGEETVMTIRFTADIRPWVAPNRKRPHKHAVELVVRATDPDRPGCTNTVAGTIVTTPEDAAAMKALLEAPAAESAEISRLRAQRSAILELLREALDGPGDDRIARLIARLEGE